MRTACRLTRQRSKSCCPLGQSPAAELSPELLQVGVCCCWLGILPRALWAGVTSGSEPTLLNSCRLWPWVKKEAEIRSRDLFSQQKICVNIKSKWANHKSEQNIYNTKSKLTSVNTDNNHPEMITWNELLVTLIFWGFFFNFFNKWMLHLYLQLQILSNIISLHEQLFTFRGHNVVTGARLQNRRELCFTLQTHIVTGLLIRLHRMVV